MQARLTQIIMNIISGYGVILWIWWKMGPYILQLHDVYDGNKLVL